MSQDRFEAWLRRQIKHAKQDCIDAQAEEENTRLRGNSPCADDATIYAVYERAAEASALMHVLENYMRLKEKAIEAKARGDT